MNIFLWCVFYKMKGDYIWDKCKMNVGLCRIETLISILITWTSLLTLLSVPMESFRLNWTDNHKSADESPPHRELWEWINALYCCPPPPTADTVSLLSLDIVADGLRGHRWVCGATTRKPARPEPACWSLSGSAWLTVTSHLVTGHRSSQAVHVRAPNMAAVLQSPHSTSGLLHSPTAQIIDSETVCCNQ